MKITSSLVAALLIGLGSVASSYAQGTVNYVTYNGADTTKGQFLLPANLGGGTAQGPNFVAQLWAGSGSDSSTFTAVANTQVALSTASTGHPGYVLNGQVTVSGAAAGSPYNFQIRVWNTTDSANWVTGDENGSVHGSAASSVFSVIAGGGSNQPQLLNGFANVTLIGAPEPATLAMLGLGAASLLIVRRRK